MPSYWDVIVPIVAAWVGNRYGNPQGDTPNQYPAELPPEMKRIADEAWRVYLAGGTPTQKDVRTLALQAVGQAPSEPTGFKFLSQELQGQPFAGGIKAPKFDLTKLPSQGGGGGAGSAPPPYKPPPLPGPNFNQDQRRARMDVGPPAGNDGPAFGDTIADSFVTHPGMTPRDRGNRFIGDNINVADRYGAPPAGSKYSEVDFKTVADAWDKFKTEHPNWAKLGASVAVGAITAGTGLAGLVVAPILKHLVLRDRPAGPTQPGGQAPGGIPIGGTPSTVYRP